MISIPSIIKRRCRKRNMKFIVLVFVAFGILLLSQILFFGKESSVDIELVLKRTKLHLTLNKTNCSFDNVQYHLIVEGTFFKMQPDTMTGISIVWLHLLQHLSTSKRAFSSCPTSSGPQHKVIYIDRAPGFTGSRAISAYRHKCEDGTERAAVIMVLLEQSLEYTISVSVPRAIALAGYGDTSYPVQTVYTSTYYTFPDVTKLPAHGLCMILYVHDTIPEVDGRMQPGSQWWPRKMANWFVNSFVSVSKATMRDYVRLYAPHVLRRGLSKEQALALNDEKLESLTHMTVVVNRISRQEFPGPASAAAIEDFRMRYNLSVTRTKDASHSDSDYEHNYLLSLGGKNFDLVLNAFDKLPDELVQKFSLVFCTGTFYPNLNKLQHAVLQGGAAQLDKVAVRIHNLKYLPRNLMNAAMSGSFAVVYTSSYEGFGLPIAEAFASGTMVVTSNWSAMPEVGGNAAWYVNSLQPTELTSVLNRTLRVSRSERQERITEGLKQAAKFGGSFGKTQDYDEWQEAAVQFVRHIRSLKHRGLQCYAALDLNQCV